MKSKAEKKAAFIHKNFSLGKGRAVMVVPPETMKTKPFRARIHGFGVGDIEKGIECYWVMRPGNKKGSEEKWNVNFLMTSFEWGKTPEGQAEFDIIRKDFIKAFNEILESFCVAKDIATPI